MRAGCPPVEFMRECGCVEEAVGGGCERCTSMGAGNDVQRAAAAAALCGGRVWARAWAGVELCCAGSTQAIFWLGAGPASTASFPCDSRCQGARAGKGSRQGRSGGGGATSGAGSSRARATVGQEGSTVTATATARNRGANGTAAKAKARARARARTDGRALQ